MVDLLALPDDELQLLVAIAACWRVTDRLPNGAELRSVGLEGAPAGTLAALRQRGLLTSRYCPTPMAWTALPPPASLPEPPVFQPAPHDEPAPWPTPLPPQAARRCECLDLRGRRCPDPGQPREHGIMRCWVHEQIHLSGTRVLRYDSVTTSKAAGANG